MKDFCTDLWKKRSIVAILYALLVFFLMPLYVKDGFVMIGDAKYGLYLHCSVSIAVIAGLFLAAGFAGNQLKTKFDLTYTETCALFFLLVTGLGVFLSNYKDTALWGYQDWHMGGILQAFLIMGFFLVKRWLNGERIILSFAWLASFLVCALTIANRCGDDPLRFYEGMDLYEWNRRNLIATIGNINWACCYLAVAVPVLLYFAWTAKGRWRVPGYIGAFAGIAAISLQGSDTGYLDLAVMMIVLLWTSLNSWEKLLRFLELLGLIPLFWSIFSVLQIELLTPADARIIESLYSVAWLIPLAVIAGIYLILYFTLKKKNGGTVRKKSRSNKKENEFLGGPGRGWVIGIRSGMAALLVLAILTFIICQFSDTVWNLLGSKAILRMDDEWGSLRGGLWRNSVQSFFRLDLSRKLFGVGPDCFAFLLEEMKVRLEAQGQWLGATYANAHNELLTMMINEGIMGIITYLGIFVSIMIKMIREFGKKQKYVLGVMVVIAYLVNGIFTFQQVISTPFVFAVIGLMDKNEVDLKDKKC